MTSMENVPTNDSEMEEGEIIDELDDLSDISSEEEFLLRQRLQVLENYNNVLERKKAKRTIIVKPGVFRKETQLQDLSEISASDFDDTSSKPNVSPKQSIIVYRKVNRLPEQKHSKHPKQRKRKDDLYDISRNKDYKKKAHRKKKQEVKVVSESSESDDDYKSKRLKLANAVVVNRSNKNDTSSLQARLNKMFFGNKLSEPIKTNLICTNNDILKEATPIITEIYSDEGKVHIEQAAEPKDCVIHSPKQNFESIDLCTDDDGSVLSNEHEPLDTVDGASKDSLVKVKKAVEKDSDEDLELLRQHALKTKFSKQDQPKEKEPIDSENKPSHLSEDEDSDTAELRLICLKSALLKKAIERKQQQKLKKRLSQSMNLEDELFKEQTDLLDKIGTENNTDTESVDMDIGSDGEEKAKEHKDNAAHVNNKGNAFVKGNGKETKGKVLVKALTPKEDELEEDEDLLRAKLLTSLSKNLPNLVDPTILSDLDDSTLIESTENNAPTNSHLAQSKQVPDKRIIINLGESDSEGEHEATKNLTKMHIKLSEQVDFQQKLDIFLKSARMEVEKEKIPDVVQQPQSEVKTPQKFVAKVVNHLPKSEQMEYKNLVKRMAELQKIKEARQTTVTNKTQTKDTLKPRNITANAIKVNSNLDEQIALSRKNIAEESAKILKLKEEATKLAQKYKIVATELRNIATAITFNKKEQRSVHIKLSKIRIHHQRLLNSSTTKHSKTKSNLTNNSNIKINHSDKLQKENNPATDGEYMNMLKSLKVCVTNNAKEESNSRLSFEVDTISNKKVVKLPSPIKGRRVDINVETKTKDSTSDISLPSTDHDCSKSHDNSSNDRMERINEFDDYQSPLQALHTPSWQVDPNAILCPFEVGGNCKDSDCKYLHPKVPTKQ